jgi:hypothetical protein
VRVRLSLASALADDGVVRVRLALSEGLVEIVVRVGGDCHRGGCADLSFSGDMESDFTDMAAGGEGISPNLRNPGAARHAFGVCFLTSRLTRPEPLPPTPKIENEKMLCVFPNNRLKHL